MTIRHHLALSLTIFSLLCAHSASSVAEEQDTFDVRERLARANKLLEWNGITRAARIYEEVLRRHPGDYPEAAFVLGEIYEHKEDFKRAVLFYHMSIATSFDDALKEEAWEAIVRLERPGWRRLTLIPPEETTGLIVVEDIIVLGRDASEPIEVIVPPDVYTLDVKLDDHEPERVELDLRGESGLTYALSPERLVHHGALEIEITNDQGAHITLTQERADSPSGRTHLRTFYGHTEGALELPTGTYFIEIKDAEYERWIRRVHVTQEEPVVVEANLTRRPPIELLIAKLEQEGAFDEQGSQAVASVAPDDAP